MCRHAGLLVALSGVGLPNLVAAPWSGHHGSCRGTSLLAADRSFRFDGPLLTLTSHGRRFHQANAVTAPKLAADSVNSSKIVDGAVGTADLTNLAVTSDKLADNSVNSSKLAGNSVGSGKIVDGTLALADLATNSVDSSKIANGSVAMADLAPDSVDSSKILDNSINADDVTAVQIQQRVTGMCNPGSSIRVINEGGTVECEPDDTMLPSPSASRFKEEIHDMGEASSGLLRLRPVTFRYKEAFADGARGVQYGLIAEEVAEVHPELVGPDSATLERVARRYADLVRVALEELFGTVIVRPIEPSEFVQAYRVPN